MKICIPTSAHDKHLLPAQADCLLKLGGLEEHQVIYFPTASAKDAAYDCAEKLGAQTHPLDRDFEGGAPVACNNHFAAVVNALGLMGNSDPFLLMEPDMLPAPGAHRWADKLLEDYRMRGTPFMGNVVPTPFDDGGKLVFVEGDTMMMGCGMYPAHLERDERIKPLIADLAKPEWMNPKIPWDIYLRWAMKIIGVSDTPLIADMWATQNYRMAEGLLICDSVDHGDRVVRRRDGAVSHRALLIHGCKDGSLAKLVLGNTFTATTRHDWSDVQKAAAEGDVSLGALAAARIPSEEDGDDGFWGGEDKAPAPEPAPETVIPVTAPKPKAHTVTKAAEPTPDAPKPEKVKITRAAIEKAMAGKKMRASDLASKLNVKTEELIGTFATNGYIVAGGGWVQSTINITTD